MLLWRHSELVGEDVMPVLLHILPVPDDPLLNRTLKLERMLLVERFISNKELSCFSCHETLSLWTANDSGHLVSGLVISSKACLAGTGAIVNDYCCDLFLHLINLLTY